MENKDKIHQIQLQKLLFTQNWEDPALDHKALKIQPGETILTITSGGCNTLGFLLKNPGLIYAVDINGSQNWQMELKMAAIKCLSHAEFLQFLGLASSDNRLDIYEKQLRQELTADAQIFWDAKKPIIKDGFLGKGRFEKFVKIAGKLIHVLQGKKRVQALFSEKSEDEQREFYDKKWNSFQMRMLFKIMFNKRMLAKRGLNADYFHFDDGSDSFAQNFYNRLRKALRDIPIKGNYFLAMYILGQYRNRQEMPEYLLEEHFDTLKKSLDRIQLVTQDAQGWLESMPRNVIDCFALSNICELMSLEDTERLFKEVYRTARPNARVIFRNLMIPREVPASLTSFIQKNESLSKELLATDRSFVYSKVDAYTIMK